MPLFGAGALLGASLGTLGGALVRRDSQIVPAIVGDNARTMSLCERALERGIYAQGIRYPTVPRGTARLRLTPTAAHSVDEIQHVVKVLGEVSAAL